MLLLLFLLLWLSSSSLEKVLWSFLTTLRAKTQRKHGTYPYGRLGVPSGTPSHSVLKAKSDFTSKVRPFASGFKSASTASSAMSSLARATAKIQQAWGLGARIKRSVVQAALTCPFQTIALDNSLSPESVHCLRVVPLTLLQRSAVSKKH